MLGGGRHFTSEREEDENVMIYCKKGGNVPLFPAKKQDRLGGGVGV